jgi:uncharacterized protein with HEPN domain
MNKRDDSVYLQHILEAMELIEEYLTDIDFSKFNNTRLLQDGVIRQFEIIGEATKNLSQNVRDMAPVVPWKDMAGMRDKLIHQYFGVDIEAVWATAQLDLPTIRGNH